MRKYESENCLFLIMCQEDVTYYYEHKKVLNEQVSQIHACLFRALQISSMQTSVSYFNALERNSTGTPWMKYCIIYGHRQRKSGGRGGNIKPGGGKCTAGPPPPLSTYDGGGP